MNGLNWFQAFAFAKRQRRAIRRAAWRRWVVFRGYGWYCVDWTAEEAWRVVLNTDLTSADYQAKDWATEPWENGPLPACCPADQPTKLAGNATGGSQSWGPPEECGGLALAIHTRAGTDDEGGLLDYVLLELSSTTDPLDEGIELTGDGTEYVEFLVGYTGPAGVIASARASLLPAERCYVWLRSGAKPTGPMVPPYVFAADGISALAGSLGPVLAYAYEPTALGQLRFQAGAPLSGSDESEGVPNGAFADMPQSPGATVWARMDFMLVGGGRRTQYKAVTMRPWDVHAVSMAGVFGWSVSPDSSYISPGPDGILSTEDDVTVPCWVAPPATATMTVEITVTTARTSAGALSAISASYSLDGVTTALVIDGVTYETVIAGKVTTITVTGADYVPGATYSWSATWSAAADQYGAFQTLSAGGTMTLPALCP